MTVVESWRKADRPELAKALHHAKVTGATLVIAKLDRLSRNAAFLLALMDIGVRFGAVDMPEANDFTVGIMALVAETEAKGDFTPHERGAGGGKSARGETGQSERGGGAKAGGHGKFVVEGSVTANAAVFDTDLVPVLAEIRGAGAPSLRTIAARIKRHWIRTRRIEK